MAKGHKGILLTMPPYGYGRVDEGIGYRDTQHKYTATYIVVYYFIYNNIVWSDKITTPTQLMFNAKSPIITQLHLINLIWNATEV